MHACWLALWLAVPAAPDSPAAAESDPYRSHFEQVLADSGFPPTGQGALAYLRELRPDAEQRARIEALIAQLASDDYAAREQATAQLLRLPGAAQALLAEVAERGEPEARWRARMVLDQSAGAVDQLLLAAYGLIASERPPGAVADLLETAPLCRKPHLRDALHRAIEADVRPDDAAALQTVLVDADRSRRWAAAVGLAASLPSERRSELEPLLADADGAIALSVAVFLANAGERRSLPALVRLLADEHPEVRGEAGYVLQLLAEENFGFAAYDPPERRAESAAAWAAWLRERGASAELHFPLPRDLSARGSLHGNTLISTGGLNEVLELDPTGKVVFRFPIDAWSAEKLRSGNVLIASYSSNRVVEVDPQGKVVWELPNINAMTAKPLRNGNYLVADFSGNRVIEVTRDEKKEIVWQVSTPDNCFDADRLPNGNTIFGCPTLVREVNPQGETVREWPITGRLNGFQALPNGNILVANYGESRVYELTPDRREIWALQEPQPCDVYRLPSGITLVATASRIIEVASDGKTVRELHKAAYGSIRR